MPRGGHRANAGRPAGTPNSTTVERHKIAALWREHLEPVVGAIAERDIALCLGVKVALVKGEDGRLSVASSKRAITQALAAGRLVEVFTQPPNVAALRDVKDRLMGKPTEEVQLLAPPDGVRVIHETVIVKREAHND